MENLKQRVLTGWTIIRALYLVIGTLVIVQSIDNQQWLGLIFGGYFASMGLFAFGCAAGNCVGSNMNSKTTNINPKDIRDVEFEEVKQK